MFRTLKYRPNYPYKGFVLLTESREWAQKFIHWYNEVHLHISLKFMTHAQCHSAEHVAILRKRKEIYEAVKVKQPKRWARDTRVWKSIEQVTLNPMRYDSYSKILETIIFPYFW